METKTYNQIDTEKEIGPAPISFSAFLLKILAGGVGGIAGSLIMILIFVLTSSILTPEMLNFQNQGEFITPIFVFILLMLVFLSTTASNIISVLLLALTERDKYKRISSTIYQVFILSIIVFILLSPVYFLTAVLDLSITVYVVALHIIISVQISALIMEIVSNYKYSLVGLYGITFSILLSSGFLFGIAGFIKTPQILLFLALPVIWVSIAFVGSIVTILYIWIAKTYDKDFLSTQTLYGSDYGIEVEEGGDEEEEEEEIIKDEEGAEFLRKKQE